MLPVRLIADDIAAHLRDGNRLVLTAPTGSGKTTQVPQIIHLAGVVDPRKSIVVLQPRRLATRLVARRVAQEMRCPVGSLVGYQTRHESEVSPDTRIRFMTEGLLLRRLQDDPTLRDVGAVVLDEFHERSLDTDIVLALLRRLQSRRRSDLKLMVMSATLDAERVCSYLDCPSLHTEGRAFPVEIEHLPKPPARPVWNLAAESLESLLRRGLDGDVLVFMPRVYEINRTLRACGPVTARAGERIDLLPLHGSLPPAEQDRAVTPGEHRRVIVATNVAETSITIEGVTAVIDSGLANAHRYDAARAMNRLRVEPISRASGEQRTGRAGRTAPGVCVRLWTAKDHAARPAQTAPEVHRVELAAASLTLRSMGIDPASLDWLDAPAADALAHADALLRDLGGIDEDGRLTERGQRMAAFPAHPRLARMLLDASERGCVRRACTWAALIAERDIATREGASRLGRLADPLDPPSDLAVRERALEEARRARFDARRCGELGVGAAACREADRAAAQLERIARRMKLGAADHGTTEDLIRCALASYGDHVAVKLDDRRPHCAMTGRARVSLDETSIAQRAGPILALDVREVERGPGRDTVLALASCVEIDWLIVTHPRRITDRRRSIWNADRLAAERIEETLYDGLTIASVTRDETDTAVAAEMIVERIVAGELKLIRWDDAVDQWIARVRCVAAWFPEREILTYSDDELRVLMHEIVSGATRWSQAADRPVLDAIRGALDWNAQQLVEKSAPARIDLPSGHRMPITYTVGAPPRGSAKIQQLYGLDQTPTVAAGRVPIVLEILGPNHRPVQVTGDLASFWKNTYPSLKKELMRRYPKHKWL